MQVTIETVEKVVTEVKVNTVPPDLIALAVRAEEAADSAEDARDEAVRSEQAAEEARDEAVASKEYVESKAGEIDTAYNHSQEIGNPHETTFAQIGSKPSLLSGYGITDAYTQQQVDSIVSSAIVQSTAAYVPLNPDGSLPTPATDNNFTLAGEGDYGGGVIVADGHLGILSWDGSSWSKVDEVELPSAPSIDNLTSTSPILPLSANQGRVLNEKIETIVSISPVFSFLTETTSFENTLVLNSSSTFSGFGTNTLPVQDFQSIRFYVRSWDVLNPITKIRAIIREDDYLGNIIADKTIDVVFSDNITEELIEVDFGNFIENTSGSPLFVTYLTDGHATFRGRTGFVDGNQRYSTNKDINNTILTTPGTTDTVKMYVEFGVIVYESVPNPDFVETVLEPIATEIEGGGLAYEALTDLRRLSTLLFDTGFGSANWINETSIFSGWGQSLTPTNGFNGVKVKVRYWDINNPITSVRILVRETDRFGAIISDETLPFSADLLEEKDLISMFPTYNNSLNVPIWVEVNTDGRFGRRQGLPNPSVGDTSRFRTTSSVGSTFADFSGVDTGSGVTFMQLGIFSEEVSASTDFLERLREQLNIDINTGSVELSLPDKIYAVVGDTLQLFFRGIVKDIDPYKYDILVTCSKGNKYPRYFEYTPVLSDVGTTNFNIKCRDKDGGVIGEKTCQLITRNTVKSPTSLVTIGTVGDSLTAAGTWVIEASRRLIGSGGSPVGKGLSNISFKGRKQSGGVGFEGTGGWTWTNYATAGVAAYRFDVSEIVTVPSLGAVYANNGGTFTVAEVNITAGNGYIRCTSVGTPSSSGVLTRVSGSGDATINFSLSEVDAGNPFWNASTNSLDFPSYVDTYMDGVVDCMYFLLTWNGQTPNREDFSGIISTAKILIDHIHANYPDCKIKIMGVQVPSINGGMGYNYGATGSSYADGFGMVKTALNMNKAYQDWCNEVDYIGFMEFVNVSSQFDSEYNMPSALTPVNSRNSETELRGTNGVHPNTQGYYQIADVVFRNVVANYCQ